MFVKSASPTPTITIERGRPDISTIERIVASISVITPSVFGWLVDFFFFCRKHRNGEQEKEREREHYIPVMIRRIKYLISLAAREASITALVDNRTGEKFVGPHRLTTVMA